MLEFLNQYLQKSREDLKNKRLLEKAQLGPAVADQNEADIPQVPTNLGNDFEPVVVPSEQAAPAKFVGSSAPQYDASELATPSYKEAPISPINMQTMRSIASEGYQKDPAAQAFEDELRKKMQGQIGSYEQAIEVQKKLVAARQAAQQNRVDLSPLYSLVDSNIGSEYMKGYKAPKTEEEFLGEQAVLQNAVASQEGGLLDKVRGALATPDADFRNFIKLKQLESSSEKLDDAKANRKNRVENKFTEPFSKNVAMPLADYALQKNVLVKNIQEGTPDALQSVGAFMARLYMEKGPLSDNDVGRTSYTTYKTDLDNFLAKVQNNPDDVQLPQLQASLQKRASLLLEETENAFSSKLQYFDDLRKLGSYKEIQGPGEVGELVDLQRKRLGDLKGSGFKKEAPASDVKSKYEQDKKAGIYAPKR